MRIRILFSVWCGSESYFWVWCGSVSWLPNKGSKPWKIAQIGSYSIHSKSLRGQLHVAEEFFFFQWKIYKWAFLKAIGTVNYNITIERCVTKPLKCQELFFAYGKGLVEGKQIGMVRYICRDHRSVMCIWIATGQLRNFLVKSDPE
jgi:hypothetical protein